MKQRRSLLLLGFAALLWGITLPLYGVKVWQKIDYTDFDVYYRAATRLGAGHWDAIYSLSDGASPFRYAPPALPLLAGLRALTLPLAKMTWYFLQYSWFIAGFYFLYLGLRRIHSARRCALIYAAVASLFVLRFCLDTFTIGQVSSLLFFGFSVAFWGVMRRKSSIAGLGLALPTLFKIGPGILYFYLLTLKNRTQAILAPLAAVIGLSVACFALTGAYWDRFRLLWEDWWQIVRQDSNYYDASHYGSQSLKSFLLRSVRTGWMGSQTADAVLISLTLVVCLTWVGVWVFRKPRSPLSRGLFFSMGIFPYLWLMPETFKYSLTVLAIPFAVILALPKKNAWIWTVLIWSSATLSVAGKDLLPDSLFFGLQQASIPFFSTLLLGWVILREAWKSSTPRFPAAVLLGPWAQLPVPKDQRNLEISLILPRKAQSHPSVDSDRIQQVIRQIQITFESHWSGRYEILLIPYGSTTPNLGRGEALREGYLAAKGRVLFTGHLEQPCEPDFYVQAYRAIQEGYALVRANRRLAQTRFWIPVRLLKLVYGRHRLGLLFNRVVKFFLPIQTTDTHSGTLAMSRDFAHRAFALQSDGGFLFDLELAAIAALNGTRQIDLPVVLHLLEEKSIRRMARETWGILWGLPRLRRRLAQGCYQWPASVIHFDALTADDWGMSPGINEGILALARARIIKRISIMSQTPHVAHRLEELLQIPDLELGLHFNLTYGLTRFQSATALLSAWLWQKMRGCEDLSNYVQQELRMQLERLKSLGVSARYIDGHQHIHLMPGLLDTIAPQMRQSDIRKIRLPTDPRLWKSRHWPVAAMTALARRRARILGLNSLPCLYPSSGLFGDFASLQALLSKKTRFEIITHPASIDDVGLQAFYDPYRAGRVTEFRALRMIGELP